MALLSVALGAAVVRATIKLWTRNDSAVQTMAIDVVSTIAGWTDNAVERRRLEHQFDDLAKTIDDQIRNSMSLEFRDLPDNERAAAALAVADALNHSRLSTADLLAADLNTDLVYRAVMACSPEATRDLSGGSARFYDQVLRECCRHIVNTAQRLPNFSLAANAEMLARLSTVIKDLRVLRETPAGSDEAEEFERRYRDLVASQLDRLEVVGVAATTPRRYALGTAYVSLELGTTDLRYRVQDLNPSVPLGQDDEPEVQKVAIEEALAATSRLFLRGDAGSGKTTVLQWIAVQVARGDFSGTLAEWNHLVPFSIRLRGWSDRPLPRPEEFLEDVGRNLSGAMPARWVQETLMSGRGVVLVDGVDELSLSERERVRQWLGDLVDTYPTCRYVVTSRPSAAPEEWLAGQDFDTATIEPMRLAAIRAFVEQWHLAYLEWCKDEQDRERIQTNGRLVNDAITASHTLQQLAASPLLAALLCALHLDSPDGLPTDRMDLYRRAIDLLMAQRRAEQPSGSSGVSVTLRDALFLLQDLAYWLIRNEWPDVVRSKVKTRLERRIHRMQHIQGTVDEVLQFLLDRSGLLREPTRGRIDFVHRTFQEYLAAKEAVDQDEVDALVSHAENDLWQPVVVMAAGHGNKVQRNHIIVRLLDRASGTLAHRARLNAVAVACLETAPDIDDDVRARVQRVAANLLPPRTLADAETLAAAGEFVLDLIAQRPIANAKQAVATIRLASRIGGAVALRVMAACAVVRGSGVRPELLDAWGRSDNPDDYARMVLRAADIHDVEITDSSLVHSLQYLRLINLRYRFDKAYGSVSFVATCPELRTLLVIRDDLLADLGGLTDHPSLRSVALMRTGTVNIESLVTLRALTEVRLAVPLVRDVSILRDLASLRSLHLSGDLQGHSLADLLPGDGGLTHLAVWEAKSFRDLTAMSVVELDRLRSFILGHAMGLRDIHGIGKWADTMTELRLEAPSLEDLAPIAELPRLTSLDLRFTPIRDLAFLENLVVLRSLHVGGKASIPDLTPIRPLAALSQLIIAGHDPVDLSPLAGKAGLTVTVLNARRRRITGRDALGDEVRVATPR